MSQKLDVMHEVAAMATGCESTQNSLLRNGNSEVIYSSEPVELMFVFGFGMVAFVHE